MNQETNLKRVRWLRSYQHNKPGDVVSLFRPVANVLIRRHLVEACDDAPELETAMVAPGLERAVKRKRGRPRKVR